MKTEDKKREAEIKNYIREFRWVPMALLQHLFCNKTSDKKYNNDKRFLKRVLNYLITDKVIAYDKYRDAYYNKALSPDEQKPDQELLKALWIMGQYNDIDTYYAGPGFIKIVFVRNNTMYDIVCYEKHSKYKNIFKFLLKFFSSLFNVI